MIRRTLVRGRTIFVSLAAIATLVSSPSAPSAPCALSALSAPSGIAPAFLLDHAVGFLAVGVARAKDLAELHRDLADTGSDFRLRVSAALALGQMGRRESVRHLIKALDDPHPAVRASASAALAKIGDGAAIGPIEAAAGRESVATVKAQHQASLIRLRNGSGASPSVGAPRFVVKLGTLANKTGVKSPEGEKVFRDATRAQLAKVPGALLPGEREDASTIGKARSLPVVGIDGSISKLNSAKSGNDVGWDAQVEYLVKQLPQQALKSTIRGRGKALASASAVRGQAEQAQLQVDAVNAAVESALGDAGTALHAATK